jgi:hypothetical protein
MRSRVGAGIDGSLRRLSETVVWLTPAARAISRRVGGVEEAGGTGGLEGSGRKRQIDFTWKAAVL